MLNFIIGVASSISSVIITVIAQSSYNKYKQKGLRAILHFSDHEITFIYPPRKDSEENSGKVILPRTATEDFLAMNNFQSALLSINWKGKTHFKSSSDFKAMDKHKDLVFICSSFSNPATKDVLESLEKYYNRDIPQFHCDKDLNKVYLRIGGARFDSESYEAVEECIANGKLPAEGEINDYGIILKATNPWDNNKKVIILAGIRGIGTWGAAECLKKSWKDIYQRKMSKGTKRKTGDFVAVIKVVCNQSDLTEFKIEQFYDLD